MKPQNISWLYTVSVVNDFCCKFLAFWKSHHQHSLFQPPDDIPLMPSTIPMLINLA